MAIVIGIDVGTSGLKAIAVETERGAAVASAHREYPLSTPHAGWAEQEPEDFAAAALSALGELARALGPRRDEVRAIGLTGQMHSAVLLDEAQAVIRPAILWCDTRTTAECQAIHANPKVGDAGLARLVGNRALEGFTLPKLLWLRQHEPEAFARVRAVLMPKDFVGLKLTGELGTDDSDASGTLAFSPGDRAFSAELLDAVGVPRAVFPKSAPSNAPLGKLTPEVAAATGLPAGTLVVRGAADNAAGAVGLGIVRPGRAMASVGTSGVILAHTDTWVVEPEMRLHSFCHAVPGRFYLMGVMLAAGGALRWYRDVLGDGERMAAEIRKVDPYEIISDTASTARPGAGGVVFLPYLMGERTPHNDAAARGAFVGLSARTTKADLSRAVLEGITFGLADSLDLMRGVGQANGAAAVSIDEIRLTGGGARSGFWRQLMADVFEAPVAITTSTEGPAYGAALLGAAGAGLFSSVEEAADAFVHVVSRVAPDQARSARYREIHAVYRGLYSDLRGRFRELGKLA
ncbi:xylulokinase [Sorangium sp. So ce834]|uniref:xylulokinase n=1 Tax=Sorangium sp. So ce834 TaxID=3133321 RepID=UPI003F5F5C28